MNKRFDVAIIGAGMAGASLAAEIAGEVSVLILEAEDQPGYHSTGRSAAFWSESYGGPLIQPLTTASGPFLANGYLTRRGGVYIADAGGRDALDRLETEFSATEAPFQAIDGATLRGMIPGLRPDWDRGLLESRCSAIDVAALHAFYLKRATVQGAAIRTSARLLGAERKSSGWLLDTKAGGFEAAILVNAAGAWADEIAAVAGVAPVEIRPYRRTMVQLRIDPPAPPDLPLVLDARGLFYFKPEAGGRLWLSPHDETPCAPGDCAAEELDIALAIDRLQQVVDWRVERVEHSWAGLRSFAPDRLPVYGFANGRRDFFWCAGQGGFGIQTAPAAAKLAASLLLGRKPDAAIAGIDPVPYLAERFTN